MASSLVQFFKKVLGIVVLLCFLSSAVVLASYPKASKSSGVSGREYGVPEIQFRFDSQKPFEVPAVIDLAHDAPVFGDKREIFLRFNYWNGVDQAGIMSWKADTGLRTVRFKDTMFPSSLRYSDRDSKLYFELVNYGYFGEGLFSLDSELNNLKTIYQGQQDLFTSDLGRSESRSTIAFRSKRKTGGQSLSSIRLDRGERQDFLETVELQENSKISWIFAPRFSSDGRYAVVKVRKGSSNEFAESQPDEIRVYNFDKEGRASLVSAIHDKDADADSPFVSFDNVAEINSKGNVVFGAKGLDGRRGYFFLSSDKLVPIVKEGREMGIEELPHFYPKVNDRDEVVFRARTKFGESVMLFSQGQLSNLLKAGDRLKSDLGGVIAGDVDPKKNSFFNSPQINNHGDVLVGVLLREPQTQVNVGLGFYIIPRNSGEK